MFWTEKFDDLENFLGPEPAPQRKKTKGSSSITKNKKR